MAKLVILTQGMTGREHELKAERTTIGRVEDNTFQIAEASVSSHHCEILLRGNEVVVKDLDSTNGTFINDEKITEGVLNPGQVLRLGQVELKLGTEGDVSTPVPAPAAAPAPAQKPATKIMPRGVSLNELETGGGRPPGFDTSKEFSKKTNKTNTIFLIVGIVAGLLIIGLIIYALAQVPPAHK